MIDSIYGRDYPVLQGLTIALAVLVSLTFLAPTYFKPGLTRGLHDEPRSENRTVSEIRRLALPRTLISGTIIIGASLLIAFFPALFAPYDPIVFDYNALLQAPSWRIRSERTILAAMSFPV